jgi:hypothetical protein
MSINTKNISSIGVIFFLLKGEIFSRTQEEMHRHYQFIGVISENFVNQSPAEYEQLTTLDVSTPIAEETESDLILERLTSNTPTDTGDNEMLIAILTQVPQKTPENKSSLCDCIRQFFCKSSV